MVAPLRPHIDRRQIEAFCRERGIAWLALFGSVLRDDFRPESDVDVLIEFEPDHVPGLFEFSGYALELENIVGKRVDLHTPRSLSRYFRERVIQDAETLYGSR